MGDGVFFLFWAGVVVKGGAEGGDHAFFEVFGGGDGEGFALGAEPEVELPGVVDLGGEVGGVGAAEDFLVGADGGFGEEVGEGGGEGCFEGDEGAGAEVHAAGGDEGVDGKGFWDGGFLFGGFGGEDAVDGVESWGGGVGWVVCDEVGGVAALDECVGGEEEVGGFVAVEGEVGDEELVFVEEGVLDGSEGFGVDGGWGGVEGGGDEADFVADADAGIFFEEGEFLAGLVEGGGEGGGEGCGEHLVDEEFGEVEGDGFVDVEVAEGEVFAGEPVPAVGDGGVVAGESEEVGEFVEVAFDGSFGDFVAFGAEVVGEFGGGDAWGAGGDAFEHFPLAGEGDVVRGFWHGGFWCACGLFWRKITMLATKYVAVENFFWRGKRQGEGEEKERKSGKRKRGEGKDET